MKTTFTKIIASFFLLMIMGYSFAQVPQAFNYQAVARDISGNVLPNHAIGIKIYIHSTSAAGPVVYQETHTPTTNPFGLFTIGIGLGTSPVGDFTTIPWGSDNYYIQVDMDAAGGTAYTTMGTSQLLSVPYAMFAGNSGNIPLGTAGQTLRNNGTNWVADTTLFNNGSFLGIGTTNPSYPLDLLHDGGTGLRVKSRNSFSVIDIDAQNGDAALWFAKAGINQWNIRNNATTDDLEFIELGGSGQRMVIQNTTGNVGVNCTSPAYKFEVDGPTGGLNISGIRIQNTTAATGWSFYPSSTGDMILGKTSVIGTFNGTTGAYTSSSDARLKTDIHPLESVLPLLMGLEIKRYEFINNNPLHQKSIGVLAQDLQKIYPELVSVNTSNEGNPLVENQMGVDYSGMSVLAIKAIQELQVEIELLKQEIKTLKEK